MTAHASTMTVGCLLSRQTVCGCCQGIETVRALDAAFPDADLNLGLALFKLGSIPPPSTHCGVPRRARVARTAVRARTSLPAPTRTPKRSACLKNFCASSPTPRSGTFSGAMPMPARTRWTRRRRSSGERWSSIQNCVGSFRLGRPALGRRDMETALKRVPVRAGRPHQRSAGKISPRVRLAQAREDRAGAAVARASDLRQTDYAEAHYSLGKTLLERGSVAPSVQHLETAVN